jgi:hypothetical protein
MPPRLVRIAIFPVKSLEAVEVSEATIAPGAGLVGDREYAIVDAEGKWVTGKRTPLVQRIRGPLDVADRSAAEQKLSRELGMPVHLERDPEKGFPDDTNAPGPTLVSTASLREAASWFGIGDLEEARRRFRANLEIDGVPAFWEDQLIGQWFRVGEVRLFGTNACARCVVPSRDSQTGEQTDPSFQRIFAERRQAALPTWSDPAHFSHYYRLALNTRVGEGEGGKPLRRDDMLELGTMVCP